MSRKSYFILSLLLFLTISCQRDDDVEELTDCIDLAFLKGEWAGEFDQYNYGRYPMFMNVDRVEGCRFYGILRWPTLRNSITTMEGYFKNDTLFWTEPSLIQGSNIILDGDYIAPFTSKNRLDGSWYFPNQPTREGGVFSISKD